jgi:4-hydroxy-L-threonine phosphate dehydrogenase PdxA
MTHNVSPKPTVGLLLGDPSGIGPELVAKLLADASFDPASSGSQGSRRIRS